MSPSVKDNVFHWVIPAVARPELQFMDGDSCSYERVTQFDVMALRILPQIASCPLPDLDVDRDAVERGKERVESRVFRRPGAVITGSARTRVMRRPSGVSSRSSRSDG